MADPMKVTCPYCGAKPRGRCMRNPGAYRHRLKFLPPHVARIRAADREREKDAALRGEVTHERRT